MKDSDLISDYLKRKHVTVLRTGAAYGAKSGREGYFADKDHARDEQRRTRPKRRSKRKQFW